MRITSVRVRKLVSGPGYNHTAVEAEAAVEADENPSEVCEKLSAWVDGEIRGHQEVESLRSMRDDLRYKVDYLRRERDAIEAAIRRDREVIRAHDKLRELAIKNGLDVEGLSDDLPF